MSHIIYKQELHLELYASHWYYVVIVEMIQERDNHYLKQCLDVG